MPQRRDRRPSTPYKVCSRGVFESPSGLPKEFSQQSNVWGEMFPLLASLPHSVLGSPEVSPCLPCAWNWRPAPDASAVGGGSLATWRSLGGRGLSKHGILVPLPRRQGAGRRGVGRDGGDARTCSL